MKKKFWQFKDLADGNAELLLYGEIMSEHSWWDDGDDNVYLKDFIQDLESLGNVPQITLRINSVGGDIFAAIAIYSQLKMNSARVVAIVDGLAASAATLPLMAADDIQIPDGAIIMIHDPLAVMMGEYNSADLAKQQDVLETIKQSIISIYSARTGLDEDTISGMMSGETWMQADEAIENGFADTKIEEKIDSKIDMKGRKLYMNSVTHDLSGYKTMPELQHVANIQNAITEANKDSSFVTRFVASAKSALRKGKRIENTAAKGDDSDDDPDEDPDEPDDEPEDKKTAKDKTHAVFVDEAAGEIGKDVHLKDVAAFKNLCPNFFNRVVNDARTEERQRIQAIDALAGQVDPKLLNDAKFGDKPMTAMELSYESMKSSSAKGTAYLAARQQAATGSGVEDVGAAPGQMSEESETRQQVEYGNMIAGYANKKINPNFHGKEVNQ